MESPISRSFQPNLQSRNLFSTRGPPVTPMMFPTPIQPRQTRLFHPVHLSLMLLCLSPALHAEPYQMVDVNWGIHGDFADTEYAAAVSLVEKNNAAGFPPTYGGTTFACSSPSAVNPSPYHTRVVYRIKPGQDPNPVPGQYWTLERKSVSDDCPVLSSADWQPFVCIAPDYTCPVNMRYVPEAAACIPFKDRPSSEPNTCPPAFGNPIYPLTGLKRQVEPLGSWLDQDLQAVYDTRSKLPFETKGREPASAAAPSFGPMWHSSWHQRLAFQSGGPVQAIQASRGAHRWVTFTSSGTGIYLPAPQVNDRLQAAAGNTWRYTDARAKRIEIYDAQGQLQSAVRADGMRWSYLYSDAATPPVVAPSPGLLIAVQDPYGRSLRFQYSAPAIAGEEPRVNAVIDPLGQTTALAYSPAGQLQSLTWPDGATRQWLYETPALPWALTGVIDENTKRYSTYAYDTSGRAIETGLAAGADHFKVTYGTPPYRQFSETYDPVARILWRDHRWVEPTNITVTLPNSSTTQLSASSLGGTPYLSTSSQSAGAGCAASTSAQTLDANGNTTSRNDWNGNRSCYAFDLGRNLETTQVQGLTNTAVCASVLTANAALPASSRKISTQWHPDWRLETKRAEPGRITTWVYHGQSDPFTGAVATCAPVEATLPDGKPIAVLCKTVQQATTDASGALGFGAALQAGVATRTTSRTYDPFGKVLSETDPLGRTTTLAYYPGTTPDHTLGDLQSSTNAKGQVTQFTHYNPAGALLQSVDANGVVTVHTYDPRGRLRTAQVGTELSTFTYDAAGQLKKVQLPNAQWIGFDFDDAHRQTAVYNHKGHRIDYTLDNTGNPIATATKDPGGQLRRQSQKVLDALSRVQQNSWQ
jgi:YD repeat-containing protein